MEHDKLTRPDVVNALSGVLALCDVTVTQIGNRARSRQPLLMIRRAIGQLLECELPEEPSCDPAENAERTVLVVDEDLLSLVVLEHELRRMGMLVLGAHNPELARRLLSIASDEVEMVIWSLHGDAKPPCEAVALAERGIHVTFLADKARCGAIERPLEPQTLRDTLCSLLRDGERRSVPPS